MDQRNKFRYVPFYVIPILIAIFLVITIRVSTSRDPSIAGYPICPDTAKTVTLDAVTNPQTKISTHPRCWSGWISFSQSNFSWSVDHGTRTLEYYFHNGVREAAASGGQQYTLKKYPGGEFRLRGEEGVTTVTLIDPKSPQKSAGSSRGEQWEKPPSPPRPAKLEPLPAPPPSRPAAATYQPLPPEQPKRDVPAASYQPLPSEPPHRDSGAASFQPLPSSPSQQKP